MQSSCSFSTQVLHQWLSSNPNYEEVTHWYLGWKDLIPEVIRDDPRVAAQLGVALSLMNCSVEGVELPPVGVYPKGMLYSTIEQLAFFPLDG